MLDWLLDIDSRTTPGGAVSLRLGAGVPAWALVLLSIAGVLLVVWVYRREGGPRGAKVFMATLRGTLLVGVIGLLGRPELIWRQLRTEPSFVAVLLDDSTSMTTRDRHESPAGAATTGPTTRPGDPSAPSRWERTARAIRTDQAAWLARLAQTHRVALYRFSDRSRRLASITDPDEVWASVASWLASPPRGRSTDLVGSTADAVEELSGRRLAGLVVISDGRATGPADADALIERCRRQGAAIHAVMVGRRARPMDAAIVSATADRQVFVRDVVAVEARVRADGLNEPASLRVRLTDALTDRHHAERDVTLTPQQPDARVTLEFRPTRPGRIRLRVGVGALPGEIELANNRQAVEFDVVDAAIRVMLVDAVPRYEYRYLRELLRREPTIRSSALLVSAMGSDGAPQDADVPIRRFPDSPEELANYDVILWGDLDPAGLWIGPQQMAMVVEWVSRRGGGFGMIAGEAFSPRRYVGTSIETLLPIRIDPSATSAPANQGFRLRPTAETAAGEFFRFSAEPRANAEALAGLPPMWWYAPVRGIAPAGLVVAEHPAQRSPDGPAPLVVVGRYGAGKTFFSAVDGTWRWRREVGPRWFSAYWLRVVRWLARGKVFSADRAFDLVADRPAVGFGERVALEAKALDESLLRLLGERLTVEVTDRDGIIVRRVQLTRTAPQSDRWTGAYLPAETGAFELRLARPEGLDLPTGRLPPAVALTVAPAELERRDLRADPDALRRLAERTGGVAVPLDGLSDLAAHTPDRSVQIPDDLRLGLWDTRLALLLVSLIIVTEWVARKLWRLA